MDRDWALARAHGLRDAQNVIIATTFKHLKWWGRIPFVGIRQARMVRQMKNTSRYILDQINELAAECEREAK